MSKDAEFSIDTAKLSRKESTAGSTTLLSQLGFADRDKQNPRHDLATAYIRSKKDDLAKIIWPTKEIISCVFTPEAMVHRVDARSHGTPSPFIIGFADALLTVHLQEQYRSQKGTLEPWTDIKKCILEVKISPEPMGNCIRQIGAYRQGYETTYVNGHMVRAHAVLLVDYEVSTADKALCDDKDIMILRLGDDFESFIKTVAVAKVGAL